MELPVVQSDAHQRGSRIHVPFIISDALHSLVRIRAHVILASVVSTWFWAALVGNSLLAVDLITAPLIIGSIYLLNQIWDDLEDSVNEPDRVVSFKRKRQYERLAYVMAAGGILGSFIVGAALAVLIPVFVLTLGWFYSMPVRFSVRGKKMRLKEFFLVKNVVSATGWSLIIVVYPSLHAHHELSPAVILAAITMFSVMMMFELVWDIRDRAGDELAGIRTVPVALGPQSTIVIFLSICLLSSAFILLGWFVYGLDDFWFMVMGSNLLMAALVYAARNRIADGRAVSHSFVVIQIVYLLAMGLGLPSNIVLRI